jgi:hypothetical protein
MPTPTYESIQSTIVPSDITTVTLSSIPNTYTDLVLVIQPGNSTSSGAAIRHRINGNAGSLYSSFFIDGLTGNAIAARATDQTQMDLGWRLGVPTTGLDTMYVINYQSYTNTNIPKSVLHRGGGPSQAVDICMGVWRDNSAINSLSFTIGQPSSGNFVAGSTFTLYGIRCE